MDTEPPIDDPIDIASRAQSIRDRIENESWHAELEEAISPSESVLLRDTTGLLGAIALGRIPANQPQPRLIENIERLCLSLATHDPDNPARKTGADMLSSIAYSMSIFGLTADCRVEPQRQRTSFSR